MSDLLNPSQRGSVAVSLKMFEEQLRLTSAWLDGREENGILYCRKLNLTPARRQVARQRVAAALQMIANLAQEISLEQEVEDPAGLIRGEFSVSWANLIDTQSRKLKRYGDVNPEAKNVLDPAIQKLAQLAMELASIFISEPEQ
jgi:hypothetical protein